MRFEDLLSRIGGILDRGGIPYFVFGAAAMNLWVTPRTTSDVDIVVCVARKDIQRVADVLNAHGFQLSLSLRRKMAKGGIVQLPIGKTKLDIKLCTTDHDRTAAQRAQRFEREKSSLTVAKPEDIILYKLAVWRRQDQADIERIVSERKDLDWHYIKGWILALEEETGLALAKRWAEFR